MSSGSQNRKTTAQIKINCRPEQKTAITAIADDAGQSPAALCLNALLNTPLPPRRRRPVANEALLARVLAEMGKNRGELNKCGSNLNQIAYHLNAGRPGDRVEGALAEAIEDFRQAVRTFEELRLVHMQALGLERDRKPPADEE
jgi:hypothetical protein